MTEYVYKLKNGKVISAYADEKGNISITKEALEIMANGWNDGYQQGRADEIKDFSQLIKCGIRHNIFDSRNSMIEWIDDLVAEQLKEEKK